MAPTARTTTARRCAHDQAGAHDDGAGDEEEVADPERLHGLERGDQLDDMDQCEPHEGHHPQGQQYGVRRGDGGLMRASRTSGSGRGDRTTSPGPPAW
jgi:hypothetical protein